jgi:hypothetical protein
MSLFRTLLRGTGRSLVSSAASNVQFQKRHLGVLDSVTNMATNAISGTKENQFEKMLEQMIATEPKNWTLRPWKKTMEDQLNGWIMYVPGVSSTSEVKEIKHFKLMLDGAARFFPQVKDYLTNRNIEHLVHDGGQIAVKYKDIKVRLQLFDGSEPILRATVTILHNVTESVKFLREINRLNATRVCNRIWVDNKMLVVGSEMRCDETKMLTPILDGLVNEARYLGGLLGPLYGGTTPAAA